MAELGRYIAILVALYLATGALVGPVVVRKLRPDAVRSDRESVRRFATFVTSKPGMVISVAFWPVTVTVYRFGFFLGAWDWKGHRSRADRAN